MSLDSARQTLGRYIGVMAARLGSHLFLRPGEPVGMRAAQGDSVVLPGEPLSAQATEELARACMPESGARALEQEGEARFIVRAVELRRRYVIRVRRRPHGLEMEITGSGEPPAPALVLFDPRRNPPTLVAEAELE